MTNAALYLHPDAHDSSGPLLVGRRSAGESFLRGFLQHADVERFYFWCPPEHGETLEALVARNGGLRRPATWFRTRQRQPLCEAGVFHVPGPNLGAEAWSRRILGQAAYSICGLTHTISSGRTTDNISDLLVAPVDGHDAMICTSAAVRAAVEAQLEGVRAWFAQEYGGRRRRPEPQLATIPLGVETEAFAPRPSDRERWRQALDIPQDGVAALYVGRFSRREKMNPALMAIALERAAQASPPLYWINAGWAETPEDAEAWEAVRRLCPSVGYRILDGRLPDVRTSIWAAADFFLSFSDNIQETFGLTPVEAMAAALPCVITDWDGYRDTVRHGEDGFRIPTTAPPPTSGRDLAYAHANAWISYRDYVGAAAQLVAIDYAAAAEAISALATNPDLRQRLGRQAQARARAHFDWSAVIPQYQALWGELNARRAAAAPEAVSFDNPFRPDPFSTYVGYSTRRLAANWTIALPPLTDIEAALELLASDIADYSHYARLSAPERRTVLEELARLSPTTVAEVLKPFPVDAWPRIGRSLLWMARYGVVALAPPA